MINPILSAINERLESYTKTFCLLERSEKNKTIQYSGGGSFNTIPFDTYKVGGYWRLRSNVAFTEAAGTIACTKKQTITYPLYFVAWFRRDEVEDFDEFAQITAGTISTLRTPSVRTQVRGYNIDQQQSETGKINDNWMVIRFDVDVVFTKICPTTCANIEPICKLLGSINDIEIGEFFSDFNIIVENTEGTAVGEWEGTKWIVPTSGGGGDVELQVNGAAFITVTAPATFNLPVIQGGSPVGSKVGDNWVIPACPDTTISIPQAPLTSTQPAGETLVFSVVDEDDVAFADFFVSASVVDQLYKLILRDQSLGFNSVSTGGTYSRRLSTIVNLQDTAEETVPATLINQNGSIFTFELPDIQIRLNGPVIGTILPKLLQILLTDGTTPVTPDAINLTGNDLTLTLPSGGGAIIGSMPFKTGAEAQEQAAANTYTAGESFWRCKYNNPFGNDFRLCSSIGYYDGSDFRLHDGTVSNKATVFPDNLCADFSQYDPVNDIVLQFTIDLKGLNANYAAAETFVSGLSQGGFSDFFIGTIDQLMRLQINKDSGNPLDIEPFDFGALWYRFWTSTPAYNSTQNLCLSNSIDVLTRELKTTNNIRSIPCRWANPNTDL